MGRGIPERLKAEQQAVESQIREAFRGVSRANCVSWSESVLIDNYDLQDERQAARMADREPSWEDLVEDPDWCHEPGNGGFNFLDPIGFQYYIAPAVIRCARCGYGEFIGHALKIDGDFKSNLVSLFSPAQRRAIARFVRFMITTHAAEGDDIYGKHWQKAYASYWKQFDAGSPIS